MKKSKKYPIGTTLLFTLPFLIPLLIFWIIPLIYALGISFTDWDLISPTYEFVGLENYIELLKHPEFLQAFKNTIVFSLGVIIPTIILGFGMALLFQKYFKGIGFYKVLIFSPWVTPMVAVSIVWTWIFEPTNGIANQLLQLMGHPGSEWLKSSQTAMMAVIIVTIWKGVGWTMIFYIGAIEKVPETIYEAAAVDGAGYIRKLFSITIPLISPTTFFLIIVNLINCIQAFDQIDVLTKGGPAGSTRTLLYMYYQRAFQSYEGGSAAALSIIILLIILILALINSLMAKKWVYY